MTRVAIVGTPGNETNCDLARRWSALGLPAVLTPEKRCRTALEADDVVLGRLDVRPTLDGIEPGLLTLLAAERDGAHVLNRAAAVLAAHDKLRTARALAAAGVPHPRTAHVRPGEIVPIEPPLVLKPRFGSWGTDVHLCLDEGELECALAVVSERPWFRRQGAIAQRLVPPAGYDVRIVVAGGVVVGAVTRFAKPGEWRTNVSLGGIRRPAMPGADLAELALAAVAALGGDFFGVDLLPFEGGAVVLEVNAAVEFTDEYSLGGGDVFAVAARALGLVPRSVPSRRFATLRQPAHATRSAIASTAAGIVLASSSSTGTP